MPGAQGGSHAMRAAPFRLLVTAALVLAAFAARPAVADWPALGRALTAAPGDQNHARIASDGADGAIVTWQDGRGGAVNIFAQHVAGSGVVDAAWPVDGRALLTDPAALATAQGGQKLPLIVPDGTGGAFVAWQDERNDLHGPDVFAQHVLPSGAVDPAWPANGLAVCVAPGVQDNASMVSDGEGGAILTWMDGRNGGGNPDIFAQHVLPSGAVDSAWPADGVALCTAPMTQAFPKIASDGSGGAIVTWYDLRRPSATQIDIYAQHVLRSGAVDPAWPVDGRGLCLDPSFQVDAAIAADGHHGAIVAWTDLRDGSPHIYAQRVLSSGAIAPGWPANGIAVAGAPVDEESPALVTDGAGGAIVGWRDTRNGSNSNPYAQHVLASGTVDPAWPADGRALGLGPGEATSFSIASDGRGGAIVAWEEDSFILANRVLASGLLDSAFPANGRFLRLQLEFEHGPDLVVDGRGNAIVAWDNQAPNEDSEIYAQLVTTSATVGVDPGPRPGALRFAPPSPNPASGPLTLRFALPREAAVRIAVFDAGGRRVRELFTGTRAAGEHSVAWDLRDESGRAVGAGIYFARLEAEGQRLTRKVAAVR